MSSTNPGDRSAAEIERDVERTRARLTGTVEELKDRVSPGQMAEQAMDWLRSSGGRRFAGNLGATVRDNPVTAEYARLMSGPGAEYRTLVGAFQRCIVVDRKSAFISDHVSEGSAPHAAWYVTDRAVVGFIAAAFEDTWQRATPWHGELRCRGAVRDVDTVSGPDPGVRTSALQRAVLRDMAAGIEQRITASRLGIGLRTLTEEIRVLKELAGARTLHELTYWWALSPDRLIDDGPVVSPGADATAEESAA